MLCNHQFTLPLTDGRVLQQVLAHLAGDEHEGLLAGKQANRSINTYFQPAAPRPPPIVPDPRQLCWGLHTHDYALRATMPELPGATRTDTVGEAREVTSLTVLIQFCRSHVSSLPHSSLTE
jgi:hypothetical protein